ncbi:hypothetical protein LFYK43_20100 [Ligilactobacillus salitolerans]|uniref:Uncharacterized protein n=1 Tax=Ligilactobacillus salitolerans TaxID=1808352 RepID=A0A401IVG8_9LACO|nr:hypothetical protein [Ligilactobacillus salitolerans]GBG95551.1 hypothetical protein LFYK43_20100 [Ligilactobacillus salitolerans]
MTKNDLIAQFQDYDLYVGPKRRILKKYHADQKLTDRTYELSLLDFSNLMGQIRRYNADQEASETPTELTKLQQKIESRFLQETNQA